MISVTAHALAPVRGPADDLALVLATPVLYPTSFSCTPFALVAPAQQPLIEKPRTEARKCTAGGVTSGNDIQGSMVKQTTQMTVEGYVRGLLFATSRGTGIVKAPGGSTTKASTGVSARQR